MSVHATNVAGNVVNNSVWNNTITVPGDGSNTGTVMVGVWGETVVGIPLASSNLTGKVVLPYTFSSNIYLTTNNVTGATNLTGTDGLMTATNQTAPKVGTQYQVQVVH
jgi:hypothetical protein